MTTIIRDRLMIWDDPQAVTFTVYGWSTPTGIAWKLSTQSPAKLGRVEYDFCIDVTASVRGLDDDVLQELNRRFGWIGKC